MIYKFRLICVGLNLIQKKTLFHTSIFPLPLDIQEHTHILCTLFDSTLQVNIILGTKCDELSNNYLTNKHLVMGTLRVQETSPFPDEHAPYNS